MTNVRVRGNIAVARGAGQLALGENRLDGRLQQSCVVWCGRQDSLLLYEGVLDNFQPVSK